MGIGNNSLNDIANVLVHYKPFLIFKEELKGINKLRIEILISVRILISQKW